MIHFKALLNELALKKSFKPDVLFIDYLNICSSSRFKGGNISSYFYIKAIAEELRGLAVEFKLPIFTATQTTRSGFVSTDIGLEDGSHSRHYNKNLNYKLNRVFRSSKHRYIYFTGTKKQKKILLNSLKYKIEDYPKGNNQRYDASYEPQVQLKMF